MKRQSPPFSAITRSGPLLFCKTTSARGSSLSCNEEHSDSTNQGWRPGLTMKIHRYFGSQILKLLPCVDQQAAGMQLEQGLGILKLLLCIDQPASGLTRAGSVSFVGEGHCPWNRTLRMFLGSQTAFQVSSSQEAAASFTLVWWIQGIKPITLSAVGVARISA